MISRHLVAILACAWLSSVSTVANADECKLARIANVDFTDQGQIIVPVSIEGTNVRMGIDTGSPISAVDPNVAHNLRLIQRRMLQGMLYDSKGEPFTYVADLHSLGLGEMTTHNLRMLVWPSPIADSGVVGGVLGTDLLRNYDVDIDFGAHTLSLFSQDHCPGKVVYRTSGPVGGRSHARGQQRPHHTARYT